VAISNRGRIAAVDTPAALRATIEARRSVEVSLAEPAAEPPDVSDRAATVESFAGGTAFRIYSREPGRAAQQVAAWATAHGLRIESICTRAASLEDVFLSITGTASMASAQSLDAPR